MLRHEAAFNVLCGRLLGEGIHRQVFECRIDETLVVKVESDEEHRSFANANEWSNWVDNQHDARIAKWLAPCVSISPCGLILLQRRVQSLRPSERPDSVPSFLTDIKDANFGLYDGRVVACDYSTIITTISARPKKAAWF